MKTRQKPRRKLFWLILFWLVFIGYINWVQPSSILSFSGFYILLSASLYFTFKLFTGNFRSLIWITLFIIYLLLRQFRLDNILNSLLLLGILITLEIYFRKS